MGSDPGSAIFTFLFTDIEGSTALLRELGPERYANALDEHRRHLRAAFSAHHGVEVDTQGDAIFFAFPAAPEAAEAAAQAQLALAGRIRVRMGMHTGSAHRTREGYVGESVHLGARIAAAGHGGQVLLSRQTRGLIEAEVTDLGEHRLKDFPEPVWIYQLGTDRFPPLKTISNTNLPRPASSFVGREREVDELAALIRKGERLVTLTGAGGSGKTRLAIEAVASLVSEFRNGTFWVDLSALRDPSQVMETVANTIGAGADLADYIGEREMLLLLDNVEQVLDSGPGLATLVETCPNLRLVVTSRELMRVRGEVEFSVPPLAATEAVDLFCARARVGPEPIIGQLCRRLDNLPLAVELAAARVPVLSVQQILERLSQRLDLLKGGRDADSRQRTLRATIEWSHDLLTDAEKRLFARLSVFSGGCTLDAAESVCQADVDTLQSLVDKNLVRPAHERFSMLETVREFATQRLEESGEASALRQKHADFYMALAAEAEQAILGADPQAWLERLGAEDGNLRAALDWLGTDVDHELALGLAGTIWEFWCLRGRQAEGFRRLEQLLEQPGPTTRARAKALTGLEHLSPAMGVEPDVHRLRAEAALAAHREVGDEWGIAFAEHEVGLALALQRDWAAAAPIAERAIRRFGELRDEHRALQAIRIAAWCYESLGEVERSKEMNEEMLRRARAAGDRQMEARALNQLGRYATDAGSHHDALRMLSDALRLDREFDDPFEIGSDLIHLALALASAENAESAVRLLAQEQVFSEEMNLNYPWYVTEERDRATDLARSQLDDATFDAAWAAGTKLTIDQAAALALASRLGFE